jgi:hypothetical protein
MIRLLFIVLLANLATAANAGPISDIIYPGVDHQVIRATSDAQHATSDAQIDVVSIAQNPNIVVNILSSSSISNSAQYNFKTGGSYTITDYYYHVKPLAIVAGGHLSSFSPPIAIGEIMIKGLLVSPIINWAGSGIFCTSPKGWVIEAKGKVIDQDDTDCIQSAPILIQDGQVRFGPSHSPSRDAALAYNFQNQSFVCITYDSKLILGVSTLMRLDLLAEDLKSKLDCKSALSLTGGDTAALYYGGRLVGSDSLPLTSVIAVINKKQ